MRLTKKEIFSLVESVGKNLYGCSPAEMTKRELYNTLCMVIKNILEEKNRDFEKKSHKKKVYYMSMEFLVGRSLKNNLFNLGILKDAEEIVSSFGKDLNELFMLEPDAGLGNGGLGRLASCYMDSMTTLGIPATGYSIRYEFGIFKQKIIDTWQVEFPDNWLSGGDVWLKTRENNAVTVKIGGKNVERWEDGRLKYELTDYVAVKAVPHDLYVSGYNTESVNKLVLWSASSEKGIDMNLFSRGEYVRALEEETNAEVISKVLYPADDHMSGKILRIKQQYFFVSASLQSIVSEHFKEYKTVKNLHEKIVIHINDTHPAMCIPELMRILLDDFLLEWDEAWDIVSKTMSYTNHTVMSEALERWNEKMFAELLPRVHQIIVEINRRLYQKLTNLFPGDNAKIEYMAVIANGEIRMANLCLATCHKINGVSKLHTDILTSGIFKDYYSIDSSRFVNVTNGIAYRRWLCQANPLLSDYVMSLIGNEFLQDASALEKLIKFKDDKEVQNRLYEIKQKNKIRLSEYIAEKNGINVDENSIFDVQIKRLHEYKRQLLNILHVLYLYKQIKAGKGNDIYPRTFIFAAKASPGYYMAKQIIKLIVTVAQLVNNDPQTKNIIKVVFIEDYKVSLAELIIPATNISEQISVAGKEASGTGNMKLMINGAVTLGTLDGANVEIFENVGEENIFLFGLKAHEVETVKKQGYNPADYLNKNPELKEVIGMLTSGELGARFDEISNSLLRGGYGGGDEYLTIADFNSYAKAQRRAAEVYAARDEFERMSIVNIAKAGHFSSDRSIKEYAQNIWNIKL